MRTNYLLLLLLVITISCSEKKETVIATAELSPIESIQEYHGIEIKDSYEFLENSKDSLANLWYKENSELTKNVLDRIPNKEKLFDDKESQQIISNGYIYHYASFTSKLDVFYIKLKEDEKIPKLFLKKKGSEEEKLIFDPNLYKENYKINYLKVSPSGDYVILSLAPLGEVISELVVLDVNKKEIIPNIKLENTWSTGIYECSWLQDETGFTYIYIPDINKDSKNYILDTESRICFLDGSLKTIFSKKNNPDFKIESKKFPTVITTGKKHIFGEVNSVSKFSDTYFTTIENAKKGGKKWRPLFKRTDSIKKVFTYNSNFYFLTSKGNNIDRICMTSIENPDFKNPEILIEADTENLILNSKLTKDGIYFVKSRFGLTSELFVYEFSTRKIRKIELPHQASKIYLKKLNSDSSDIWVSISSWVSDAERYFYDYKTNTFKRDEIFPTNGFIEIENAEVKEIEIVSHDGEKVPLSLIYRKGTKLDSNNRTMLYGYGSYGSSITPRVSTIIREWIDNGGVYAIAHVRGGGEKGADWHMAGQKSTKPNTWKDFIACAEYLIDNKYTSPDKLVIKGRSAGGILVGRAITERPDLFKAAVVGVGLLNTVRSEFGHNGQNNIAEFGTVKDSLEFQYLLEMDSYHHIKPKTDYPALLVQVGMNDARVPPWHSGKFVAQMRRLNPNPKNPVLFWVEFDEGHMGASTSQKGWDDDTNEMAFLLWQTGHPDYQLEK
ncbi:prolyl oligopeptidase family serine peptidase [Aureivirga sp. CE67]|uniref:prolyl oligopeptidase family serine peptidase n=1 Tax=Aureivirga sp. CE67 TaxID=1788983 RepID=UPI0018CBEA57|nr:prolyl oligopeptidase family serine peptidase [Aureivirga sp. CE67]